MTQQSLPKKYRVALSGVTGNACMALMLKHVVGKTTGRELVGPSAVYVVVLQGDVNASGDVTTSDLQAINAQYGQTVAGNNFRCDVNHSGNINLIDTGAANNNLNHTGSCTLPPASLGLAYEWDAENRLTRVVTRRDPTSTFYLGDVEITFAYDYMGRRVRKTTSVYNGGWQETSDLKFVYDNWNVVEVLNANSNNAVKAKYTWGLDLSGTIHGAGGIGGLLTVEETAAEGSPSYWFLYDGNGNVGQLINADDQSTAAHYEYDSYGNPIVIDDADDSGIAYTNPIRFSTKWFDNETGLGNWGYRYYSPRLGRWISRDPIGEEGGVNLYGFVENGPQNYIDAIGLWIIDRSNDEQRAKVTAQSNDTVDSLALIINLQPEEYMLWLRQLPNGLPLPISRTAVVPTGCSYSVPNLVVAVWGYDYSQQEYPTLSADVRNWIRFLTHQGYQVNENTAPSRPVLSGILGNKDMAGFLFAGHGTDAGDLITGPKTSPNSPQASASQKNYRKGTGTYRIAFMYLYACYSADASAGVKTPSVWAANVASKGRFIGFRGPITEKNWRNKWYQSGGYP